MITNILRRVPAVYWNACARLQFRLRGVRWPANIKVLGPVGISAQGRIEIGKNLTIVSLTRYNRAGINHPTQLVAAKGAVLSIGDKVGISGASIFCTESIVIGDHVMIGASSRIYDTDFHPLDLSLIHI